MKALMKKLSTVLHIAIMFCIFSCGDDEQPPPFKLDIPIIDRIPDQLKELTLGQKKNIEENWFCFCEGRRVHYGVPGKRN